MTEQTQSPFELEDDGIPDHTGPLESKSLTGDAQDGIGAPSTRPASLDFGTTAEEQLHGESLDGRLAREAPEVDATAEPYPGSPDKEPSYGGSPAGRIVEEDEGARTDATKETVASDVGADHGGFTAEEAAMHIEPDA